MKVGSERQAATSPGAANAGLDEIGVTSIGNFSAGTLQNWRFHREDYSEKAPGGYAGKVAKLLEGTRIMLEI